MARAQLDQNEIIRALQRVDWDFPGSKPLEHTIHSLHRFPGNFIPQIPAYLIQLLSSEGDLVFDPFCGSGTTGVEAAILRRRVWQIDANRVSALVSQAKITALAERKTQSELSQLVQEFFWALPNYRTWNDGTVEGSNPELHRWFHPDTLAQLRNIWNLITSTKQVGTQKVLSMLFSDTLFACASTSQAITSGGKARRHHWGWIADNVVPKKLHWHNAERLFHERLIRAYTAVLTQPRISDFDIIFQRDDIRKLQISEPTVDLVVTSPPYLGMIDYAMANRLTYLWFNWPINEDREIEIGARFKRNRLNAEVHYLESIDLSAKQITRSLKPGGFCAIVIGASRKFPGMSKRVLDQFTQYLTPITGPIKRSPSRRRVSDRKGSQFHELICVFRK